MFSSRSIQSPSTNPVAETALLKELLLSATQPIPAPPPHVEKSPLGWKEVPFCKDDSAKIDPLVLVPNIPVPGQVMAWPAYYKDPGVGPTKSGVGELARQTSGRLAASPFVFARESVKEKLDLAQRLLDSSPEHNHLQLVVLDGFRTLETQQALFDTYYNYLQAKHPNWASTRVDSQAQLMVSKPPSADKIELCPPHHLTGCAVDVVLVDKRRINITRGDWVTSAMVEFGAEFDEMMHKKYGDARSGARYYEQKENQKGRVGQEACENRRLLYSLMKTCGFTNYPFEWFHFQTSGNQLDAYMRGEPEARSGSANSDYQSYFNAQAYRAIPHYEAVLVAQGMSQEKAEIKAREDLGIKVA